MKNFYKHHIFFCNNEKQGGKKCCSRFNVKELYNYAKDKCRDNKQLGIGKIGISESRCLGRCEFGPVCVIYPDNIWYSYKNHNDIDEILDSLLLKKQIVTKLEIKKN